MKVDDLVKKATKSGILTTEFHQITGNNKYQIYVLRHDQFLQSNGYACLDVANYYFEKSEKQARIIVYQNKIICEAGPSFKIRVLIDMLSSEHNFSRMDQDMSDDQWSIYWHSDNYIHKHSMTCGSE